LFFLTLINPAGISHKLQNKIKHKTLSFTEFFIGVPDRQPDRQVG